MAIHTLTGPFSDGSPPGYDAAWGNSMENDLVAAGAIYFLGSPYALTANPTVTSGSTTTLTCTGVGGIPAGAKGVFIGGGIFASTAANGYVTVQPHGGTSGQYVSQSSPLNNAFNGITFMCPLDATGKIDVKANNSNMVLQSWYIFAYII
jgi:hypothetical protein